MELQTIKQRFGIIGASALLDRAINIAVQVASTDLSVLVTGESGVGKESFPKIIHQLSKRKHGRYIAVNCGAIPEGTIDSELFGHEKGSFTGASDSRKGYFEEADGGTLFLDEVAELPLATQVRLLRVLEAGEFMKVGSSKVRKTNVRVIAATNVNIPEAIAQGKFRQDLFYRLNSVPIHVPSLRERKADIHLLFRKFAADFSEKYHMPAIKLDEGAQKMLTSYRWEGNIRQLKNITEQISTIETERIVDAVTLANYLPQQQQNALPMLYDKGQETLSERDLLYKVLFDMRKDITELKQTIKHLQQETGTTPHVPPASNVSDAERDLRLLLPTTDQDAIISRAEHYDMPKDIPVYESDIEDSAEAEVIEESLSIQKKEKDLIVKALEKHNGKRKYAAEDLGISERTLYRKIKEYNIK